MSAHLSGEEPFSGTDQENLIKIFGVNRNVIVLMDSDKKKESDEVWPVAKRVEKEILELGGMVWITDGREIENYLPYEALKLLYPNLKNGVEQYQDLADMLEAAESGAGAKFERSKPLFAERIAPLITKEMISLDPSPTRQLIAASNCIAKWNGIVPDWLEGDSS